MDILAHHCSKDQHKMNFAFFQKQKICFRSSCMSTAQGEILSIKVQASKLSKYAKCCYLTMQWFQKVFGLTILLRMLVFPTLHCQLLVSTSRIPSLPFLCLPSDPVCIQQIPNVFLGSNPRCFPPLNVSLSKNLMKQTRINQPKRQTTPFLQYFRSCLSMVLGQ